MGILKKMGKAVGGAIVKTGKWTAASIKKKNLQNRVERRILDRFTKNQLKRMIKEYHLSGPELPERGYYKKSDYVDYAYHHFKLKTVIQWAKKHNIPIKDIMDEYIREMEAIERQYGVSKESKEEDRKHGVEDIELSSEGFEAPEKSTPSFNVPSTTGIKKSYLPPPNFVEDPYEEIINSLERDLQDYVSRFRYADEEEFRKTVFGFLHPYQRKHSIITPTNTSSMGDIVIDNGEIIIELKYANNPSTMNQGLYEIMKYKNRGKRIVMILLDVGEMNNQKLREYENLFYKSGAYKVITVKGVRRFKRRRRR